MFRKNLLLSGLPVVELRKKVQLAHAKEQEARKQAHLKRIGLTPSPTPLTVKEGDETAESSETKDATAASSSHFISPRPDSLFQHQRHHQPTPQAEAAELFEDDLEREEREEREDEELAASMRLAPPPVVDLDYVMARKREFDQELEQQELERKASAEAFSIWKAKQLDRGFAHRVFKRVRKQEKHKRQYIESQRGRLLVIDH